MLNWLKRVLGRVLAGQPRSVPRGERVNRRVARGQSEQIEVALKELPNVGLRVFPDVAANLRDTAEQIAAHWGPIHFGKEPTIGLWSVIAIGGDPRPFENAARYGDHCYDGFSLEDYSSMVLDIVALAGEEWPVDDVELRYVNRPENPIAPYLPVSVSIKATPEVTSFELLTTKDFDWSIISSLNERLPEQVTGRFAIFLDGDATIVFLTPDQIRHLNSLCGYKFFYE